MAEQDLLQRLVVDDTAYQTRVTRKYRERKVFVRTDPRHLMAYLPGVVRQLFVADGKKIARGAPLLVLEAMKMQTPVLSPLDGVIKTVGVKVGDRVAKGQLLVEFE